MSNLPANPLAALIARFSDWKPPKPKTIVRLTLEEFRINGGRPWVAEIIAYSPEHGVERRFLEPIRDMGLTGPKSSRGIYCVFPLQPGRIYEVYERVSWKRSERYFCRVVGNEIERIDGEEVVKCLSGS